MQQTQSPLLRLWQLGKDHHGGLIAAIFCAVAGVLLGLLPYLSAGRCPGPDADGNKERAQ